MSDHYLCLGAMALELAAMTPFLYLLEARELMCDLLDALCGARVTTNYIRIGGVSADLPEGFDRFAAERLDRSLVLLGDADKLLTQNPVFRDRVEGTGHLAPETLIAQGVTGPLLRAGGVAYDVRRVQPYLVYGELDFRRSGRRAQRQLRPLPGAPGRSAPEPPHDRAMLRENSRRAR